eukprot:387829_1
MTDIFKYCTNCGTQISLSAHFCSKCGRDVSIQNAKIIIHIQDPTSHLLPAGQYQPPQATVTDNEVVNEVDHDHANVLRLTLQSRNCGCVRGRGAKKDKLC